MSQLRKAAQQALDHLVSFRPMAWSPETAEKLYAAITALRAALAQPDVDSYQPLTLPRKHVRAAAPTAQDCGEYGHSEGACGNASCLPTVPTEPMTLGPTPQRTPLTEEALTTPGAVRLPPGWKCLEAYLEGPWD